MCGMCHKDWKRTSNTEGVVNVLLETYAMDHIDAHASENITSRMQLASEETTPR